MIIIMTDTEFNRKAADQMTKKGEPILVYSKDIKFSDLNNEKELLLIDLSADPKEQALLNNGHIIKMLEKNTPLPPSIKDIFLVYPSVDREVGLSTQAHQVSFYFRQNHENREVIVYYVEGVNQFDTTVIIPPSLNLNGENKWSLYSFPESMVKQFDKEKIGDEDSEEADEYDDARFLDRYINIIKSSSIKPAWEGEDFRKYIFEKGKKDIAYPIVHSSSNEEEEEYEKASNESMRGDEADNEASIESRIQYQSLFAKSPLKRAQTDSSDESKGDQTSKQARIVEDEFTISLVLPLTAESREIIERAKIQYQSVTANMTKTPS